MLPPIGPPRCPSTLVISSIRHLAFCHSSVGLALSCARRAITCAHLRLLAGYPLNTPPLLLLLLLLLLVTHVTLYECGSRDHSARDPISQRGIGRGRPARSCACWAAIGLASSNLEQKRVCPGGLETSTHPTHRLQ